MLNYTEKPQNTYIQNSMVKGHIGQRKVWTTMVPAYCTLCVVILGVSGGDGPRLFQLHSYVIARYS